MLIAVSGACFKVALLNLLQSSSLMSINFLVKGDTLHLQNSALVVDEIKIPIFSKDVDEYTITVNIERTIELLDVKENVSIIITGDVLLIQQGSVSVESVRVHEQRVNNWAIGQDYISAFNIKSFTEFVNGSKAVDTIAKSLSISLPSVQFADGVGYVCLTNAVYMEEVEMPNCSLATEACRKVKGILDRSKNCKYVYDPDRGVLNLKVSNDEFVSVATNAHDPRSVQSVQCRLTEFLDVARVNILRVKTVLEIICRVYKKTIVDVSIYKEGLKFNVSNGSTSFTAGDAMDSLPEFTIRLTLAQVQTIVKLFGDVSNVVVSKGVNAICLKRSNSKSQLMLVGTIY